MPCIIRKRIYFDMNVAIDYSPPQNWESQFGRNGKSSLIQLINLTL